MKVYKVELMVLDFDGIGAEGIKEEIENTEYGNHCMHPKVMGCIGKEIGEWHDDQPFNHRDKTEAEFCRLFAVKH